MQKNLQEKKLYSNAQCMRSRQKNFRKLDDEFAAEVSRI